MENKQAEITSTRRTEDLNAIFIDGFADGWYMALKDSFRMEFDIKITWINKVWTQGPYYCFSEGQIFYDAKEGYSCWQDALKKVNLACQIVAAKPNISLKRLVTENSEKTETFVFPGNVQFVLFRPDEGRTKLIPYVGYDISQDDFVNFLKTGQL